MMYDLIPCVILCSSTLHSAGSPGERGALGAAAQTNVRRRCRQVVREADVQGVGRGLSNHGALSGASCGGAAVAPLDERLLLGCGADQELRSKEDR